MSKLGHSESNLKDNDLSLLKDDRNMSDHHSTNCAMNSDKLSTKTSTYLPSANDDKNEVSSSSTVHDDEEIEILLKECEVTFEKKYLQDKEQKTELANINVMLEECKVQDAEESNKKNKSNSRDVLKVTNHNKDRFVFPTHRRDVSASNVFHQKYRTFGMNEPGLKMKPAIHKRDLNSELHDAFSNDNGEPRIETKTQETERNVLKLADKNKAVKFNPEVQVIYAIKKAGNSEIVLNTVEILNKEKNQQARNHQMRKSYSLVKLNTFLF